MTPHYWLDPLPAVRGVVLARATCLLFAFDAFAEHLRPAWRYGAADFNVAHFPILNVFSPWVSSSLYVGGMLALGVAALACALLASPPRAFSVFIAAGYCASWSLSMHDSYQHHYLLSWFFIAFACFPKLTSVDLFGVPAPRDAKSKVRWIDRLPHGLVPSASNWGLVAVYVTSAIVYAYTALSKTEAEWSSGEALRNLTDQGRAIPDVFWRISGVARTSEWVWPVLGGSLVWVQAVIALGYALTPRRELWAANAPPRMRLALDVAFGIPLVLAFSFHFGAEVIGLQIGWFSGYMILLALTAFLPARFLGAFWAYVTWPSREGFGSRSDRPSPAITSAIALCGAVNWFVSARFFDLPGADTFAYALGFFLLGAAAINLVRPGGRSVRALATVMLIAAPLALFSLRYVGGSKEDARREEPHHDVRYDFWRFAGGDYRRRGEWALALDAYRRANAHAPAGSDRRDREREMEQRVEREGVRRTAQP